MDILDQLKNKLTLKYIIVNCSQHSAKLIFWFYSSVSKSL